MTTGDEHYLQWKGWPSNAFGGYSREEALYFSAELRRAGIRTTAGLRVAELGFGNGAFAGWIRDIGGHWMGLEAIPALIDRARAAGFEAKRSDVGFEELHGPAALDLVVAFDVLEHLELPHIRAVLAGAKTALKPSGLVIARVPSGDSPFSGAIFHGDLTHRTLLGSSAIRQLARELGFTAIQVRPPEFPARGLGLRRFVRRTAVNAARHLAGALIANVLLADRDAVITPNLTFVLRNQEPDRFEPP